MHGENEFKHVEREQKENRYEPTRSYLDKF